MRQATLRCVMGVLAQGLAVWLLTTPAIGQSGRETQVLLDRLLAEADGLALDRPKNVSPELVALPGSRRLMAQVLVNQEAMKHLGAIVKDGSRSSRQRAYAAFLLCEADYFKGPPYSPSVTELRAIHAGATDPVLRLMTVHLGLQTPHRSRPEAETRREFRGFTRGDMPMDEDSARWFSVNSQLWWRRTFPGDRELAREVLLVLPADPPLERRQQDDQRNWVGRFSCFFSPHFCTPDGMSELVGDYATAGRNRRSLLMYTFMGYYGSSYHSQTPSAAADQVRARILGLAREILATQTDTIGDGHRWALEILAESGTLEDAKLLLLAAHNVRDREWLDTIKEHIRHIWVEQGKWPRELKLDWLFTEGVPKPPAPPRTIPVFRKRPAKLLDEPPWKAGEAPPKDWPGHKR